MSPSKLNLPGIYNPANQDKKELIANFVVRLKEYDRIFAVIKKDEMKKPPQHFIIQGQRGSGKTTLLLRLFYAAADEKKLNKFLIPVIFNEEQYGIRTLYKLWEEIARYLEEEHEEIFYGIYDEMQKYIEADDYEERCFNILEQRLLDKGKKLVLFIDNFGDMLAKFRKKERQRLREVLIQCSEIRIVGASSVVLEFHYDYSEPFFEFFKVFHLEGLTREETVALLLQLAETYESDTAKSIVLSNPGRVETLRRLSSGVPRTMILLFEIFAENEKGDAFKDLEIILDRVTPLYKHRMDGLPPQKQEIVDAIALNWDALGVKEIAKKTRISGKLISAQLNELEKNRIISKISTSTKNNFYRLSERFFNIWYLMRHGRKREKNKVLWLVRFLESWCSKPELIEKAKQHIDSIKTGVVSEKRAYYMTEALAAVAIPEEIQHEMINTARDYLSQIKSDFTSQLSQSDSELYNDAIDHFYKQQYVKSLNKLLKIRNKNAVTYLIVGILYENKCGDLNKAERFYLDAAKKGQIEAMLHLAILYFIGNRKKAEALGLAEKSFEVKKDAKSSGIYAIMLLWNDDFTKALHILEFYNEKEGMNKHRSVSSGLLVFLLAKKQYHYVLKLFRENKYDIKERYKPIYYALMVLMKGSFPDEYKKMGSEIKQTVEEVLRSVEYLAVAYA